MPDCAEAGGNGVSGEIKQARRLPVICTGGRRAWLVVYNLRLQVLAEGNVDIDVLEIVDFRATDKDFINHGDAPDL